MGNRYKRASGLFNYPTNHKKSHIFSQEQYLFSLSEIKKLFINNDSQGNINEDFSLKRRLKPAEEQAFFDLNYYLKDDLLVKVDRASMKYSLESRVPLLDHNIVEFALNLSPELKINKGVSKYLLKKVLYQYVPENYFDRPKWGFSIPLSKWMKNQLHSEITHYLSQDTINSFGIVNYQQVNELLTRYNKGEDYLFNRVWLLYILHKWLKTSL